MELAAEINNGNIPNDAQPNDGAVGICSRCVLERQTPHISFDQQGECSYCKIHDQLERDFPNDARGEAIFHRLVEQMKHVGRNKRYDCVVGVSGGTDSTYLLHLIRQFGLRPLAVHVDCGWNSEIAVSNIRKSLKKLDIDLWTYVVNWEEMKDLYRSCFQASIPWVDGVTDIAILGALYRVAAEHGVRHVLVGNNFRLEGRQPTGWSDFDARILLHIHHRFGEKVLETYPNLTFLQLFYYSVVKRVKMIRPFYYLPYIKSEAKKILQAQYDWTDYGGHHHESVFTRYIIGVWLPRKFAIDKRRVTYSALVRSRQISRDEALEALAHPPYDPELMKRDHEYVMKKLDFSEQDFAKIWALPNREHRDFPNYEVVFEKFARVGEFIFRFILPWKPLMFYRPMPTKSASEKRSS